MNLPGELFCQACGVVLAPVSAQPPPLPRPLDRQEQPPTPSAVGADLGVRPAVGVRPAPTARSGSTPTSSVHGRLRQRETGRVCTFPAGKPQLLVGRSDIADGFFPDVDLEPFEGENMGVSRRHALITARGGDVYLEDLNSTNFTFLNHQLLVPGQQLLLKDGDIIQFGQSGPGIRGKRVSDIHTCPNCSKPVKASAKFCGACGCPIPPAGPDPAVGAGTLGVRPGPAPTPHQGTTRISGARLQVRFPGKPVAEIMLGNRLTIGRDPENDLVVPFPSISRRHAQIVCQAGQYVLVDLGSSNGTFLAGQRIIPNTPQPLTPGAVIRIGDSLGNSASLNYLDAAAPMAVGDVFNLDRVQLDGILKLTIGRDPQSNLHLDTPAVSWHHAVVARSGAGHTIQDLGSTNGTYLNGQRVRQAPLRPGDSVQIGPYKLVYSPQGFTQTSTIGNVRVDGLGLKKQVRTKKGSKTILNNVSLSILPREFIALVGGSGAGKTTLMDALNGFRRAHQGRVLFNGDDLYRNYDAYRPSMGYVPQSDILHTGLTVRHALRYTAMLRLPPDTSMAAISQRIQAALKQVDMLEQIDQPITSLSGGQRKRVSIAAELLSEPSLFFLDEPTSGLDPGLDKRMMFTLNTLADSGRTIVLTTHATNNIIGQCDQVAFMSHGRAGVLRPPRGCGSILRGRGFR